MLRYIGRVKGKAIEVQPVYEPPNPHVMERLACQHCGDTTDVVISMEYVGGQGYVERAYCRDRTACWRRWDRKNGLGVIE